MQNLTMLVSTILVSLIPLIFYHLYWKPKRQLMWYKNRLQSLGYKPYVQKFQFLSAPILSSFDKNYRQHKDSFYFFKRLEDYDMVLHNILNKVVIQLINPQLIKSFFNPGEAYPYPKVRFLTANIRRVLGQGIAFSQESQWKKKRRIITAVFNFDFLKQVIPKIVETCDQELSYYEKQFEDKHPSAQKGKYQIYILDIFSAIFSNVMIKCFFGSEFSKKTIDGERFSTFLGNILSQINEQSFKLPGLIFGHWIYNLGLTSNDRRVNKRVNTFRREAQKFIESRYQELKDKPQKQACSDIVEALIKANSIKKDLKDSESYDYRQLIDEFCTFAAAGTDTTAHLLMMMIYYLALNPQTQKKLRQEIKKYIKSDDDIQNYDKLKQIKYIDYLQNQTLRIYGPGTGIFSRFTDQDIFIENVPIRKGTYIGCAFVSNHMSSKIFKDPQVFRPQRWETQCNSIHPFAFCPFSGGARHCIGKQLSLLEGKIALIRFVQRYEKFQLPVKELVMGQKFLYQPDFFETTLIKSQNEK